MVLASQERAFIPEQAPSESSVLGSEGSPSHRMLRQVARLPARVPPKGPLESFPFRATNARHLVSAEECLDP